VTLRVATWNVDSLNARLPRLFDWLAANAPDIVGLQDDRQQAFRTITASVIDQVLLSPALAKVCTGCRIDRQVGKGAKPSDHAPVIADLSFT